MFKYLALFAFLACGIQAQKIAFGSCPKVNVEENFDLNKYLGTWYEAEKYHEPFEVGGKCIKSVWSLGSNGKINVLEQLIKKKSGKVVNGDNTAVFVGKTTEAKFNLDTPGVPFGAPYWILETDYDNYTVVWSCTDLGLFNVRITRVDVIRFAMVGEPVLLMKALSPETAAEYHIERGDSLHLLSKGDGNVWQQDFETVIFAFTDKHFSRFSWILTRSRTPSASVMNKAYAVFDRYKLSKKFEVADQTDCSN